MRRRALLAAAAPLFAGCGGFTGANRSPSPSATRPDTPTPSDDPTATAPDEPPHYEPTGRRYVALQGSPFERLGVDTLPDPVPFAGDVTLLAQPAGGDAGSLRIGLAYEGDRPLAVAPEASTPADRLDRRRRRDPRGVPYRHVGDRRRLPAG